LGLKERKVYTNKKRNITPAHSHIDTAAAAPFS